MSRATERATEKSTSRVDNVRNPLYLACVLSGGMMQDLYASYPKVVDGRHLCFWANQRSGATFASIVDGNPVLQDFKR